MQHLVQADVFTASFRLSAKIKIGTAGVLGVFNQPTMTAIELSDVYISRLTEPANILIHQRSATVPKHAVEVIVLSSRSEMGPQAMVRGGMTRLRPFSVYIGTPHFEIAGTVEMGGSGGFEARAILQGDGLVPLYNATATASKVPGIQYSGEVILLNRNIIHLIAQTD